jgi:hypothetical protein
MAPTVGVKRKAATITMAVDIDGGRAKSVREAEGWAAGWGATIRALTATKQGGEDAGYCADTLGSPRSGLLVDGDRSMRRRLISEINAGRSEMRSMLAEMLDSGRVPPFMDERDRQLRYRVTVFRKRLIGEGREFREELIPKWTGRCAMCRKEGLPLKDMGLVDYEWGCGSFPSERRDHTIRDGVRRMIDEWLAELLLTTTGELNETILQLWDVRYNIVKLASERTTLRREETVLPEKEVVREWEKRAFETIYGDAPVEELNARSLTLTELDTMRTSESKLRDDIAKQHQTVFFEKHLPSLIGTSAKRRQSIYVRQLEVSERKYLTTDDAICRWNDQGGRCARCKEEMSWNWAIGGRVCTAQLDRVDVTKCTYENNSEWLCQACNSLKGTTEDMLAYDEHLLGALQSAASDEECALGKLQEALKLQLTRKIIAENIDS